MRPVHIGLTGGIGSGKSTVAGLWVGCGAVLVDTDAIARQLTAAHGLALTDIARAFGADMIGADGALARDRMRELVFAEPSAKVRLEAILHPLIGEQARQEASRAAESGARAVLFDVPLLAESAHWRRRVDWVLVVDCTQDTQIQRVVARSAWTPDMVRRVMVQQAPREQRRSIADAVIFNEGLSLQDLAEQVRGLWSHWTEA